MKKVLKFIPVFFFIGCFNHEKKSYDMVKKNDTSINTYSDKINIVKEKNDYDTVLTILQGKWMVEDNKKSTLIIKGDTALFKDSEGYYDTCNIEIAKEVTVNDTKYTARPGEYILIQRQKGLIDFFYLLGYDANEFSLMSGVNSQTIVYVKAK